MAFLYGKAWEAKVPSLSEWRATGEMPIHFVVGLNSTTISEKLTTWFDSLGTFLCQADRYWVLMANGNDKVQTDR